jgi:DNA-binding MarR family transcriptional regulator
MQLLYMHVSMKKVRQPPRDRRGELREAAAFAAAECAGSFVRLAARRVGAFLENRLTPTGLTPAQFSLMAHMASSQDDSLGALAKRTGLDPSTLTRNLQVLARQGLVEIAIQDDSRRKLAWLTEVGVRRLAFALPVWREAHAEICALIDVGLTRSLAESTAILEIGA